MMSDAISRLRLAHFSGARCFVDTHRTGHYGGGNRRELPTTPAACGTPVWCANQHEHHRWSATCSRPSRAGRPPCYPNEKEAWRARPSAILPAHFEDKKHHDVCSRKRKRNMCFQSTRRPIAGGTASIYEQVRSHLRHKRISTSRLAPGRSPICYPRLYMRKKSSTESTRPVFSTH